MAFQTRSRDPLLDSNMQAAIEQRGKELIGIFLILLGLAMAAMIFSYTPGDPNWMVSTDAPVQNWLGRPGASVAFVLITMFGKATWVMSLFMGAWGLRLVLHRGQDRFFLPLLMALPWLLLVSLHMETLNAAPEWVANHAFGLGGMIGNTFLGATLTLVPVGLTYAVKLVSVLTAAGMVALGTLVLGFSWAEVKRGGRYVLYGLILAYGVVVTLMGRGASGGFRAARQYQQRRAEKAEEARLAAEMQRAAEPDPVLFETPEPEAEAPLTEELPERSGFLKRMPGLIRRPEAMPDTMPEPELVEQVSVAMPDGAPGDDRIRAKIASVVRSRQQAHMPPPPDPDLPLTKGRGRRPDPLVLNATGPTGELPPEPPLTSTQAQLPPEPPLMAPAMNEAGDSPGGIRTGADLCR